MAQNRSFLAMITMLTDPYLEIGADLSYQRHNCQFNHLLSGLTEASYVDIGFPSPQPPGPVHPSHPIYYPPGPVDPGYSLTLGRLTGRSRLLPPGVGGPGSRPPGPVDPGYSPPWARPPVDPGYFPPGVGGPGSRPPGCAYPPDLLSSGALSILDTLHLGHKYLLEFLPILSCFLVIQVASWYRASDDLPDLTPVILSCLLGCLGSTGGQPPPPAGGTKPPPPDGGWGYHPVFGWGYFPGNGGKPHPMPVPPVPPTEGTMPPPSEAVGPAHPIQPTVPQPKR